MYQTNFSVISISLLPLAVIFNYKFSAEPSVYVVQQKREFDSSYKEYTLDGDMSGCWTY